MTEELTNKNTDLKDLFVQQNYDEMIAMLDGLPKEEVIEITLFNNEVIQKYYDSKKYDLIKQYVTFAAYSIFLFEYSAKNGLLEESKVEEINSLFVNVLEVVKQ